MRVSDSGNLTIELIRAERFDVSCQMHCRSDRADGLRACTPAPREELHRPADRVELSPEALRSDLCGVDVGRADRSITPVSEPAEGAETLFEEPPQPRVLTPVVGSPALSGLGTALIVPGTLLDVVA